MHRKRYFSLLEVMVGLGLLVVLFGMLFQTLMSFQLVSDEGEQVQTLAREQHYVQSRLSRVLGGLGGSFKENRYVELMYSDEGDAHGQNLLFTYDGGVDIYPWFSGDVLGRLYVDDQAEQLVLLTWPNPSVYDSEEFLDRKREVLLEKVKEIELALFFFDESQGQGYWKESWSRDDGVPMMLKMKLQRSEGKEFNFVFHMAYGNQELVFERL